MKKVFVFVLLLVPCLTLMSLEIGVGLDTHVEVNPMKEGSFEATHTSVWLRPALILMVTPRIEVHPSVIFGLSKESDPDDIAIWDADRSQINLGLGLGLYYHFVQREIISLCTGPILSARFFLTPSDSSMPDYDSYFNLQIQAAIPLYLDIRVSKRFLIRTGVISEGIRLITEKYEQSGIEYSDTTFAIDNFYLTTLGNIWAYFGFYLMF